MRRSPKKLRTFFVVCFLSLKSCELIKEEEEGIPHNLSLHHRVVHVYPVSLAQLGGDHWDGGSNSWISPPSLDSLEKAHGESGGTRAGVVGHVLCSVAGWHWVIFPYASLVAWGFKMYIFLSLTCIASAKSKVYSAGFPSLWSRQ